MSGKVMVIGGGLAGLTAASFAAREGASVTLYERVSELGGRARTRDDDGFQFNMGPHALYRAAAAGDVLAELGIDVDGAAPALSGAAARQSGRLHALPGGLVSLLTTGLLRLPEKIETARWLAGLGRLDPSRYEDDTLADYLERELSHERVKRLIEALVRLSSYTHAPDRMGAGAALAQLQAAFSGGVLYLHGGWSRMVEALRQQAVEAGVDVRPGVAIRRVVRRDGGFDVTARGDAPLERADAVVLALPPSECARVLEEAGALGRFMAARAEALVPVRAASLELGLSRLPNAKNGFVLGIDEPIYFSVHSNTARLAPEGGALIHCTRYLAPDESPARDVIQKELEAVVDQAQPGWRDLVVHRHILTDLPVTHAVVPRGGLKSRTPIVLPGGEGLFVAGDWVGNTGMLADASFASGREAGQSAGRTAAARGAA